MLARGTYKSAKAARQAVRLAGINRVPFEIVSTEGGRFAPVFHPERPEDRQYLARLGFTLRKG